ncbi:hypothetical protein PF005_g7845 [Phytophthora fragariae]|uniref:Uncharacterized protein n=2 Tax=Phytophthora fragariae TaxID=53985 RepID=A0A6A4A3M1_9STRA|nr:hypothetical protein PF003_g24382 [Phytophthora fragariae]KAE8943065.1 hypothetical protein PF009_g7197 [Phytophthora fragariae]KAE9004439.1 hypothetical protein PF011_g12454 [Phytophthora fragariae]KAE9115769.1 hypothetical protein PF007_g9900 [Phytophthora fragariae]KAE9121475.1 hypothetical protein PF010_g7086 [Phytophthora fragariae]
MPRRLLLAALLLVAGLYSDQARGQFVSDPMFFGNQQMAAPMMRSQASPSTSSNSTSASSSSGSSHGSKTPSSNGGSSLTGSSSSGYSNSGRGSDSSGSSGGEGSGDNSGSGSWSMSGSGSSSLEYGCDCRSVRRVSLMGASDYCLDPNAPLSSKCGNVDLGESGACPITGAQPCSPKGHVLANDSLCALDDKDETYKCVASKKDLDIQKNGKKKKKKKSNRRGHGSDSSMSNAPSHLMLTARQVLSIVVCVGVGIMVVV